MKNTGKMENKNYKTQIKILLISLFTYVVSFEFILPPNGFLPKPSLVLESVVPLFSDYNIVNHIAITSSVIYVALAAAFVIFYILRSLLLKAFLDFSNFPKALSFTSYLTPVFIVMLFNFWFPASLTGEFLIGFVISFFLLSNLFFNETVKQKENQMVLFAGSLGVGKNKIYNEIIWKNILPSFRENFESLHLKIWSLILFYEFFSHFEGLGYLYNLILQYKDFSAFIVVSLFISVLIYIGSKLIKFLLFRFYFWEPERG